MVADPSFERTWRYEAFDDDDTSLAKTNLASDDLAAQWVTSIPEAERVASVFRMDGADAPKRVWFASS